MLKYTYCLNVGRTAGSPLGHPRRGKCRSGRLPCNLQGTTPVNDRDVLQALKSVNDPELGINIVDLGLVYHAARKQDGIEVILTLSTPTCPLGEMLMDEVRDALRAQFPDTRSIRVELVWDPPWSPDRMSEAGRRALG